MIGSRARDTDYDRIVHESETFIPGARPVFRFIKRAVPTEALQAARDAWSDLDEIEPPSLSRRRAAGLFDVEIFKAWRPDVVDVVPVSATSVHLKLADGRVLKQVVSNPVHSYVAGYTVSRFGNRAQPGKLTHRYPERWAATLPLFLAVNRILRREMPATYKTMQARARMAPSWTIPGTALSTVAINVNYASHYHLDTGDFADGCSTLTVVESGHYDGGLFVLPAYRIAVDVRGGDVLLVRSHREVHGNTPVVGPGKRISFVTYLKHGIADTVNARGAP